MGPSDAGYESQCGVLGTITTKAELYSTFVDVFDHSKGFFKGTFGDFIPVRGARWFSSWVNYLSLWRWADVLDDQTRSMTAYVIVQNNQPGMRMYALVKFAFTSSINGKFEAEKTVSQMLIPQYIYGENFGGEGAYTSEHTRVYPLEILCLVIISLYTLKEVFDIGQMLHDAFFSNQKLGHLISELLKNLLDDITLVVCWTIIALRYTFVLDVADLHMKFGHMKARDINLSEIIDDVEESLAARQRWFNLWIVLLIVLVVQLFRHFSFDPRMKVVTDTIISSSEKLMPVLVVFLSVLSVYCAFGMLLFGEQVAQFKDLGSSVQSCLLILLGDWDLQELFDAHPSGASFFFWSFIVLMMLLVLNMVLAVVFTCYDGISESLQEATASGAVMPMSELLVEAFCPFFFKKEALKLTQEVEGALIQAVTGEDDKQIDIDYANEEPVSGHDLEKQLTRAANATSAAKAAAASVSASLRKRKVKRNPTKEDETETSGGVADALSSAAREVPGPTLVTLTADC